MRILDKKGERSKIHTALESIGIIVRERVMAMPEHWHDSWPRLPQQTYLMGLSLSLSALGPLLCIHAHVC